MTVPLLDLPVLSSFLTPFRLKYFCTGFLFSTCPPFHKGFPLVPAYFADPRTGWSMVHDPAEANDTSSRFLCLMFRSGAVPSRLPPPSSRYLPLLAPVALILRSSGLLSEVYFSLWPLTGTHSDFFFFSPFPKSSPFFDLPLSQLLRLGPMLPCFLKLGIRLFTAFSVSVRLGDQCARPSEKFAPLPPFPVHQPKFRA